jgi:hypothetical protein
MRKDLFDLIQEGCYVYYPHPTIRFARKVLEIFSNQKIGATGYSGFQKLVVIRIFTGVQRATYFDLAGKCPELGH